MSSAAPQNPTSTATGRYTVVERENISSSEWNSCVTKSPGGGHFFQSYEWGEFKKRLGWKPVRLTLERDGELVGSGQFLFYSTPGVPGGLLYCPKGPWLPWDDDAVVRAFFDGVVEVAERWGAHTVKIEPEVSSDREDVKEHLRAFGFEKFRWDLNFKTTLVVDLSPSEDEILANMRKSTRYSVRRAAREGVTVVEDNSPEAIDQFWRMIEVVIERNKFWHRPKDYVISSWQTLFDSGKANLFFAEHEGDRLAALLAVTFGHKYWYLSGASTDEKKNLNASHLLQWKIMKWAKERGATYYDMVNIPHPDELTEDHPMYGIYKFKAGFGGEVADFIGCYDLPIKSAPAKVWNRMEPIYYRLHQRVKGDFYY
ncbi:MAG: peptidoglycan bridge formation glycyltransferase FemA/FemB family protein [Rubrobacteraceae bacterium]